MATTTTAFNQKDAQGISIEGIKKIETQLNSYIATVNKYVAAKIVPNTTSLKGAIQGSNSEKAIITMCNNLNISFQNYVKKLEEYKTMIEQVKNNYQKTDTGATFTNIGKKGL